LAYSHKGDYDRAIADFSEAIRLQPDDAFVFYHRSEAYEKKGDHERAKADFTAFGRLSEAK
jgi:tetratricopeptide (TPR) repeat protein